MNDKAWFDVASTFNPENDLIYYAIAGGIQFVFEIGYRFRVHENSDPNLE